jgi:hypothetical protein
MGMEQTVTFASGIVPSWPAVRDRLARNGLTVQLRMIDGELAFPDELPPDSWRELRVGGSQGMVTLRRDAGRIQFVIWGNADGGLRELWDTLTRVYAEEGDGRVVSEGG